MRRCLPLLALSLVGCADQPPFEVSDRLQGDDDDTVGEHAPLGDDDDSARPSPLDRSGALGIWYWEMPDADGAFSSGAQISAAFWDVYDYGQPASGGLQWQSPEQLDDCAITLYDAADTETQGGVAADMAWLSAGDLRISATSWSSILAPADDGSGRVSYYFEINPFNPMHTGIFYEVEAAGDAFPGFALTGGLWLAPALHLSAPSTDERFVLDGQDFVIRWTGGGQDELWIELANRTLLPTGNASIGCRVINDGSFTLPGALIQQLPVDGVRLIVHQPWNDTFELDDRSISLSSSSSAQALGSRE